MPRLTTTVEAAGRDVQVRELEVDEIIQWLNAMEAKATEPVNAVLTLLADDGEDIEELQLYTDLESSEIGKLTQSEIDALFHKARELNRRFFKMRQRLLETGRAVLEKSAAT